MLTPEAQLAVSREYLAVFFLAQLGDGFNGSPPEVVREARRRMWGDESWTAGMSRLREDVRLVVELPDEDEGLPLPPDVTLSNDPRMSRVEVVR